MKTPMQEMLQWVNDYPTEVPTIHKSAVIAKAKEMLEKEKEVMCEFAERYLDSIPKEYPSVEDVYNKTFNTNQENLQDSTNGYTYYPQENKTVFNTKEK